MSIEIQLNGKPELIEPGLTVTALLESRKIRPEVVAVEFNGGILSRDRYATTRLKQGDRVEYVFYMGGGQASSEFRTPLGLSGPTGSLRGASVASDAAVSSFP